MGDADERPPVAGMAGRLRGDGEPRWFRFARVRHGWPEGYFGALVGQRIAFPIYTHGSARPGVPHTGLLRRVRETRLVIELEFAEIERERVREGDE